MNYFQDILINNHIYHNFEMEQLYVKFKKMLANMKLDNSYIFWLCFIKQILELGIWALDKNVLVSNNREFGE